MKLHGDLNDLDTVVLTRTDYLRFIRSISNSSLAAFLRASMATRPFLFVGYSLRDYSFRVIHDSLRAEFGDFVKRSYFVSPEIGDFDRKWCQVRGLHPISTTAQAFFGALSRSLAKSGRRARPMVLISGSGRDVGFLDQLVTSLGESGVTAIKSFAEELTVGDSVADSIATSLIYVDAFVPVVSHDSVKSPWMHREVLQARALATMPILPVIIEDCDVPAQLRDVKFADFRESFESGLSALIQAIEAATSAHSPLRAVPEATKVLIVEDEANWRASLLKLLSGEFEVILATSTAEARKVLERDVISVALIDLRMDPMDEADYSGLDVAEFISARQLPTRVVILTGFGTPHVLRRAFRDLGVYDVISKMPFNAGELRRVVRCAAISNGTAIKA